MHDTEMMMDPNKSKEVAGLTVGLIGLGLMGMPMAHKLSQSGAMLRVWNRNQSKSSQLATELAIYMSAKHHAMFPKGLMLQY